MKHQDIVKLHQQDISELQHSLRDVEKKLDETVVERQFGKTKNVHTVKSLRQYIARIKTILTAKLLVQSTGRKTKEKSEV